MFHKLYKPYNDFLIQNINIDWFKVKEEYDKLGNFPGMYPDVCMFIYKLLEEDNVQTILELGSGVSTLYFNKTAKKFNKQFISLEEDMKYSTMTSDLLFAFNESIDIQDLMLFNFSSIPCPDVLFLDCTTDMRQVALDFISTKAHWSIKDISWILLDDSEHPQYCVPVNKQLANIDRYNTLHFNPVSRQDRHLLINHKDNDFHIGNWFWNWKPDKVFWS